MGESIQAEAGKRVDNEVNPETAARRNALFRKYIEPYKNLIYWLCIQYSDNSENVEENYTLALTNLFRGIETYDPSKPIKPWIHFVTKRFVWNINKSRYLEQQVQDVSRDVFACCDEICADDEPKWNVMGMDNWREMYSDEILAVLDEMKPIYRDALLLQQAGYSLIEITDIEYEKGTLSSHNIDTVKSRLFLARQYMKERITRDGKRKTD